MDFGLSSGEDSESEEDEPPEGFTAAVLEDRAGWAELAHSSSVPPVTIREIHSHFVKRRLKREHVTATKPFEKGYKIYTAGKDNKVHFILLHNKSSSVTITETDRILPSTHCSKYHHWHSTSCYMYMHSWQMWSMQPRSCSDVCTGQPQS